MVQLVVAAQQQRDGIIGLEYDEEGQQARIVSSDEATSTTDEGIDLVDVDEMKNERKRKLRRAAIGGCIALVVVAAIVGCAAALAVARSSSSSSPLTAPEASTSTVSISGSDNENNKNNDEEDTGVPSRRLPAGFASGEGNLLLMDDSNSGSISKQDDSLNGNDTNSDIPFAEPVGLPPGHSQGDRVQATLHVAPTSMKRNSCYVIKLRRNSGREAIRQIRQIAQENSENGAEDVHDERHFMAREGMKGLSMCGLSEEALQLILEHPMVDFVEEDAYVGATALQWNLDRIDQLTLPLNNVFNSNGNSGAGVDVYVVDSGIMSSHVEFGGRVVGGTSVVGGSYEDCDGHGTYVAGIIGGASLGVAPGVSLFSVRVLDCSGAGSSSTVVAGLDWVANNRRAGRRSVVSLALGGAPSSAVDNSIRALVNAGVVVVVAAGNEASDSCNFSPPRVAEAITVAAVSSYDVFSGWSNRGSCVDILAPGVNVRSAWASSPTATNVQTGSSSASPHVVGAAALYLSANPTATPQQVTSAIIAAATPNVIRNVPAGTPNRMLNILPLTSGSNTNAPAPAPATTAATTTAATTAATTTASSTSSSGCVGNFCEEGGIAAFMSVYHPYNHAPSRAGYYCTTNTGSVTHRAILRPAASCPSSTDLDIYLWKWDGFQGRWVVKDASTNFGSNEEIRFTTSGGGCFSFEVFSFMGAGSYTIDMTIPA